MPYEITFTKKLEYENEDQYFNECCFGGNILADLLISTVKNNYSNIRSAQEDWGWFIWFNKVNSDCVIDIFCEDINVGHYVIHVHCKDIKKKYILIKSESENKQELETIKAMVCKTIQEQLGVKVKSKYEETLL